MWIQGASVLFALGLVACAPAAATPPALSPATVLLSPAPSAADPPPAPGARPAAGTEPGACDAMHAWDPVAKGCRLVPGGGNGWAGCSNAPAPPNGERCITGTHWRKESCDCACDDPATTYDRSTATCR